MTGESTRIISVLCMRWRSHLSYGIFNSWINPQFHIQFLWWSISSNNSVYVIHRHSCHGAFKSDQLISLVKQGFTVLVLGWVTAQLKGWIREEYFVYKIEVPPDWGRASRTENWPTPTALPATCPCVHWRLTVLFASLTPLTPLHHTDPLWSLRTPPLHTPSA